MRHAIKKIIDENGKEILLNRTKFMKIFTSQNPKMEKERKALARALNVKVNELFVECKEEEKENNLIEAKNRLAKINDLNPKAAEAVLLSFAYALGWDKKYIDIIKNKDDKSNVDKNKKNKNEKINIEKNKTNKKKTQKSKFKYLLVFASMIIVIVIGLFAIFNKNNINYSNIKYVNSELSDIFSDEDYNEYDFEKKKEICSKTLKKLEDENHIKSVKYVEESSMYEFEYSDGTLGGLMVEAFNGKYEGASKNYTSIKPNDSIKQVNNIVKHDENSYPYVEKSLKAKVMYGLGYDDIYTKIQERTSIWNSEYLSTTIDDYCTVKDFKEGIKGYDIVLVSEHGTIYDNVPCICTEEIVNEKNINEYKKDIKRGNIAIVTYQDDNSGNSYYLIKPSFFKDNYGKKELDDTIVYLGCCEGYKKDDLVESIAYAGADCVIGNSETVYSEYNIYMQDAFVYGLLCGDTTSEALKYAKSFYGNNDGEWLKTFYNDISDKANATPKIYCGGNVKMVNFLSENPKTKSNQEQEKANNKMSYEQALKIGELAYQSAYECYWMYNVKFGDDIFYEKESDSVTLGYSNITNIDEIKKCFTKKGFEQFVRYNDIKEKNGKYYGLYGDRGSVLFYVGHELKIDLNDITENKLTFTVIEHYNDPERAPEVKNELVVVNENGDWRVDEFTLPD